MLTVKLLTKDQQNIYEKKKKIPIEGNIKLPKDIIIRVLRNNNKTRRLFLKTERQ